ncbi:MAG: hypothetical protein ACRC4W_04725 [Treponemataceae bacterium]
MEMNQADFARECGVSAAAINKQIKNGLLKLNSGGKIETEDPSNKLYLTKQRYKFQNKRPQATSGIINKTLPTMIIPDSETTSIINFDIAADAGVPEKYLDMTLKELVKKFGGIPALEKHVKILKDLVFIEEREQKTQERRLDLIEKDFVISQVFAFLTNLTNQLLEFPDNQADFLIAKIQSHGDESRSEIIKQMGAGISRIVKDSKNQVIKDLEKLKSKYDEKKLDDELNAG